MKESPSPNEDYNYNKLLGLRVHSTGCTLPWGRRGFTPNPNSLNPKLQIQTINPYPHPHKPARDEVVDAQFTYVS